MQVSIIEKGLFVCFAYCFFPSKFQADNVTEGRRAAAFGILSGIGSAAFVCGTLSTRFLSTAQTFQVIISSLFSVTAS